MLPRNILEAGDDMKYGFVILNYMVTEDLFDAYDSIKNSLTSAGNYHVYIVDNGSPKEIQDALRAKFSGTTNTDLMLLEENYGFAVGNNRGIDAAKNDNCDVVVCMNNDVVIENCRQLVECFSKIYESDNSIAVIGPDIITKKDYHQNPYKEQPYNFQLIKWFIGTYSTYWGWLKYWLQMYWLPLIEQSLFSRPASKPVISNGTGVSRFVYALHGSFLAFTPAFFSCCEGFDPETFLYGEEIILAEKIRQKDLKCWYCAEAKIHHKEDVSTDASLQTSKKRFFLKHQYYSYRHLANKYFKKINP
jgi:GT2 family glycosyltransferase